MSHDLEHDDLISVIRNASYDELELLCQEIREFLLDRISKTGGHLASNLGIVELTVALHRVYDTAVDRLIFDVGHQSYVHKIITGRAAQFDTLRQFHGLSGFPKSRESIHDAYDTGHSSTSLSAALGMATARQLHREKNHVVAVIGDGSMTGGLAYEALNNIGTSHANVKIILNDNGMSIARNVGALSRHLSNLRTSKNYLQAKDNIRSMLNRIPVVGHRMTKNIRRTKDKIKYSLLDQQGVLFEDLGIKYIGPIDGYDIPGMIDAFDAANSYDGPTIVHVITKKGKGYYWSERYPRKFHGIAPFDVDNGNTLSSIAGPSYSKVFGEALLDLARTDDRIAAISAAMGTATGLGPFCNELGERFFDVGIAEQHAVAFAAGLAKSGMIPVVAIYSSFLQRAYDQIIEDVCLQNLHVIFAIDRAGLVGADGETHHGMFDLSYLSSVPNLSILCPADGQQLREMLTYAIAYQGPLAIRYPRGSSVGHHADLPAFTGVNTMLSYGKDVMLLPVGAMLDTAIDAAEMLRAEGYDTGIQLINCIKPFVPDAESFGSRLIVTIEDNTKMGGFGSILDQTCRHQHSDILNYALPDQFIEQGSVTELRQECGLTAEAIVKGVKNYFEGKA